MVTTNGEQISALWGELLSTACKARGAVGSVIDGLSATPHASSPGFPCLPRDSARLIPRAALTASAGGEPFRMGDCVVKSGDWVFGDVDGVAVVPADLADQAFARAIEKVSGENKVRRNCSRAEASREYLSSMGFFEQCPKKGTGPLGWLRRIRTYGKEKGSCPLFWAKLGEATSDPYWSARAGRHAARPHGHQSQYRFLRPLAAGGFRTGHQLRHRLAEEPWISWCAARRRCSGTPARGWRHFLGGDPRRLIFTANVTTAINLVAASLRLAAPGEILITDHEYGAMHWCWERAAQRQGLTLRTFPLPIMASRPGEIVEAAVAAMTDRTRLFFFSHVLSPTGLVLPAKRDLRTGPAARHPTVGGRGARPGMLPLQADEMRADYYAGNCHKWMLAPTGTGSFTVPRRAVTSCCSRCSKLGMAHDRARPRRTATVRHHAAAAPPRIRGDPRLLPLAGGPRGHRLFQRDSGWTAIRGRIAHCWPIMSVRRL